MVIISSLAVAPNNLLFLSKPDSPDSPFEWVIITIPIPTTNKSKIIQSQNESIYILFLIYWQKSLIFDLK